MISDSGERKTLRDYALAAVVAVGAAFFIRSYWIEAYRIPSASMRPTLEAGDTLFVAKWSYRKEGPRRGDVIVFAHPDEPKRDYIKRVVGLAGDRIAVKSGELFVNGKSVTLARDSSGECGHELLGGHRYGVCWEAPLPDDFGPTKVPDQNVFVLGDLRTRLPEAKRFSGTGLVPVPSIKAKAVWIWLSVEPRRSGETSGWFSRIRFERMFQAIE